MKYLRFPAATIPTTPAQTWNSALIWQNLSNSYVLVMGLQYLTGNFMGQTSPPWYIATTVQIQDESGQSMDVVMEDYTAVNAYAGTTSVYNGTSVVSEPTSVPVSMSKSIDKTGKAIMPPKTYLYFWAIASFETSFSIGSGWGLALDEDELLMILSQKKNEGFVIKL